MGHEVRMVKPWQPLDAAAVSAVGGYLGVYEIADPAGRVVYIGFAGGRSAKGLRGELQGELERRPAGCLFRYEVNMGYTSRRKELLMAHKADHGDLPEGNRDEAARIGRLSPA